MTLLNSDNITLTSKEITGIKGSFATQYEIMGNNHWGTHSTYIIFRKNLKMGIILFQYHNKKFNIYCLSMENAYKKVHVSFEY